MFEISHSRAGVGASRAQFHAISCVHKTVRSWSVSCVSCMYYCMWHGREYNHCHVQGSHGKIVGRCLVQAMEHSYLLGSHCFSLLEGPWGKPPPRLFIESSCGESSTVQGPLSHSNCTKQQTISNHRDWISISPALSLLYPPCPRSLSHVVSFHWTIPSAAVRCLIRPLIPWRLGSCKRQFSWWIR